MWCMEIIVIGIYCIYYTSNIFTGSTGLDIILQVLIVITIIIITMMTFDNHNHYNIGSIYIWFLFWGEKVFDGVYEQSIYILCKNSG